MHTGVHVYGGAFVAPKLSSGCHPSGAVHLIFNRVLYLLKLAVLARPTGQKGPGFSCFHFPSAGITSVHCHCLAFYVGSGDQTWTLTLRSASISPLSHLINPLNLLSMIFMQV